MTPPAVTAEAIRKRAGSRLLLDDVSMTIEQRRLTGIIGGSGAGKSMLLRLIAGIAASDQASLTVLGRNPTLARAATNPRIGYMPQTIGLDDFLTVQECIDLRSELCGLPAAAMRGQVQSLLALVGLPKQVRDRVSTLSETSKRRLGIACALIGAPPILLLDEPAAGLDSPARTEILGIARRIADGGTTVIVAWSPAAEAAICDELVLLHRGRSLFQGSPEGLLSHAATRSRVLKVRPPHRRRAAVRLRELPGMLRVDLCRDTIRVLMKAAGGGPVLPDDIGPTEFVPLRLEDAVAVAVFAAGFDPPPPMRPVISARPAMSRPALEVRGLCSRAGDRVNSDGLTFTAQAGEVLGLIGPPGSGKSTVLKMLGGVLNPSRGDVRIDGIDLLAARSAACRRLGYVGRRTSYYGNLTVRQNLRLMVDLQTVPAGRQNGPVERIASLCGLGGHLERRAGELDRRIRARVAFAAALLNDPAVLLIDEPGADIGSCDDFYPWGLIDALAANGLAIVIGSRLASDADRCDRIIRLAADRSPTRVDVSGSGHLS